jgi:hypothetical protein
MTNGREKSDPVIVASRPPNKAGRLGAEAEEPRTGGRGESGPARHAPGAEPGTRDPGAGPRMGSQRRQTPEVGAVCRKAGGPDLCGGASQWGSLPRSPTDTWLAAFRGCPEQVRARTNKCN